MRRSSFNALVVLVVLLCFARIQAPALAQPPPPAAAASTRPPSIYFDAPRPTANATYRALGNAFLADGQAAKLLADLTAELRLSRDIPVRMQECPKEGANAFYDRNVPEIRLCYELFGAVHQAFMNNIGLDLVAYLRAHNEDYTPQQTAKALLFVLMHEIGHWLIDEFHPGLSGKEEDAADTIATMLALKRNQEGVASLGGMALYLLGKTSGAPDQRAFFDAHAVGAQRLADVWCTIYGSDPSTHAPMVQPCPECFGSVTPARAGFCPSEYDSKKKWVDGLLKRNRRTN